MKNGMIKCITTVLLMHSAVGVAGSYSDALGQCLVASTTEEDRNKLVRWMFVAASNHPAVQDLVNTSQKTVNASNQYMGEMITTLLTQSCKSQAKQAIVNEGNVAIEASFNVLGQVAGQVLGQVAGQELFSHPSVASGLSGLEQFIDSEAIKQLAK